MLGNPLVRFCEGRGGNWWSLDPKEHPVYSTEITRIKASFSRGFVCFDGSCLFFRGLLLAIARVRPRVLASSTSSLKPGSPAQPRNIP